MAKADATLVKASLLEAKTRAGGMAPDMSKLYQSTVDISSQYLLLTKGIMDNYKAERNKKRIALEKQMNEFTKIAEEGLVKLYSQKEPMPNKVIDAVEQEIERLKLEFEEVNTLGKNDTKENKRKRRQLMGDLSRVVNEAVNTRASAMILGEHAEIINLDEVNADIIDPTLKMINLKEMDEDENVSVSFGKNGLTFTAKNYWSTTQSDQRTVYHYVDPEGNEGTMTFEQYQEAGKDGGFKRMQEDGWEFDIRTENVPGTERTVTWGDPVSMTYSEILDAYPIKDFTADTNYIESLNNSYKAGKQDGLKNNPVRNYHGDDNRALFLESIDSKDAFRNFATRRIENLNEASFKEALLDDINIPISILDNMFIDMDGERVNIGLALDMLDIAGGADGGPDGIINAFDLTQAALLSEEGLKNFEANMDILIDVITNVDNEAFDLNTSKELLADYYMSFDEQKYEQGYENAIKSKQKSNKDGIYDVNDANYIINNRIMNPDDFDKNYGDLINFLENPEENKVIQGATGGAYKYVNGNFYQMIEYKDGSREWVQSTMQDIAATEGILNEVTGGQDLINNSNIIPDYGDLSSYTYESARFTGPNNKKWSAEELLLNADMKTVGKVLRAHFGVTTDLLWSDLKNKYKGIETFNPAGNYSVTLGDRVLIIDNSPLGKKGVQVFDLGSVKNIRRFIAWLKTEDARILLNMQ